MKVDVSDIRREIAASRDFEGEQVLGDITWQGEPLRFRGPLHVRGRLLNGGEELILTANVRGVVVLQCGACLESYEQNLDFSFEAELRSSPEDQNSDSFLYQGNEVALSDIVLEFLLLEIPIRRRCREDCKGLCPVCGVDLNRGTCRCGNPGEASDMVNDQRRKEREEPFSTKSKEV